MSHIEPPSHLEAVGPGDDVPSVALIDSSLVARPRFELLHHSPSRYDDLIVAIGAGLGIILHALGDDEENPFGAEMLEAAEHLSALCREARR